MEDVGEGWGAGDRGYLQLNGADMEIAEWPIAISETGNGYVESDGTQSSVGVSGGGSYNARFMIIGEFPLEVITGETPLNGPGLR